MSAPRRPAAADLPLSVWPTAQRTARVQRAGRYLPESTAHPARMLPETARRAITTYTQPGDLVLDPMCGIGTTLVEAVHLGRAAIGVEYEPRWADIARANLMGADLSGATGDAHVITGDARRLSKLIDPEVEGHVALVLTSPPYGASLHGQVKAVPGAGVAKSDFRYSHDPHNLAHASTTALLDGFRDILAGCVPLLRPGGIVAVTARPWREQGRLVDLSSAVLQLGEDIGLIPYDRLVALLVGLRGDRLVPRASFFALNQVRQARRRGNPLHVIAHEDILVLRKDSISLRPSMGCLPASIRFVAATAAPRRAVTRRVPEAQDGRAPGSPGRGSTSTCAQVTAFRPPGGAPGQPSTMTDRGAAPVSPGQRPIASARAEVSP
ncbi:MAG TPA: DNA methyltransferase [Mycobacteriales bacterium]|nr:DNA methyltransferase [Mycobacteriales bacterium]